MEETILKCDVCKEVLGKDGDIKLPVVRCQQLSVQVRQPAAGQSATVCVLGGETELCEGCFLDSVEQLKSIIVDKHVGEEE